MMSEGLVPAAKQGLRQLKQGVTLPTFSRRLLSSCAGLRIQTKCRCPTIGFLHSCTVREAWAWVIVIPLFQQGHLGYRR